MTKMKQVLEGVFFLLMPFKFYRHIPIFPDNENAMEVEENSIQVVTRPVEEIHPLALVAINVDVHAQNIDTIVEAAPLVHVNPEVIDDSNNGGDRISPTESAASSRAISPANFEEESNQSEDVNINEPNQSSKKRTYSDDEKEDDGSLCPICLDDWTNTGEHRICALKCGHLFGQKCINRWLNLQRKKTCPTCKKRVGKDDIRFIYAKKLTAIDTTELDNMKKQLELVIEERNKAQSDLAKYACREHMLNQEIAHLKSQLNSLTRHAVVNVPMNPPVSERVRLYMDKAMEICKYGGSRVFDAKCELDLLMASMKSPTNLFNGFGLKKINISGYRTIAFIPVHSLQIRDICFHQENNWVLTASMDKTFKVINNHTNTVIYQFNHQMPLWSCCWDLNNSFILYVGTQSGSVIKYDIRQLTEPISTLSIEGDMSPVVSVASIPSSPGDALPQGGVVSCKLNSLWLYENVNSEHNRHSISLEGPFVSMKYQPNTKQLLVSSRPNSRIMYARHTLCNLEKKDQDKIDCNIVHSFQGGGMQKLLSKSCFLSHTSDYVAAHQENCRSVFLWSINTGQKVCSLAAHESVLDLKGLQNQHGSFLVSLTDKKLEFFKFV
jgi:E3 ubiquitin-protein ligase RFWD3